MEITTDYSNVKWQENGKLKLLIIVGLSLIHISIAFFLCQF